MSSLSETTGYIKLFHLHTEAMSSLSETTGYITLLQLHTEAMSSLSEITGCITLLHMHTEATRTTTTQALPQASEIQLEQPARLKACGEQPVAGKK